MTVSFKIPNMSLLLVNSYSNYAQCGVGICGVGICFTFSIESSSKLIYNNALA